MIRNFSDFCRELNQCGFSMGGGSAKAIQKICDSFRVSDDWKERYKQLRPELRKRR